MCNSFSGMEETTSYKWTVVKTKALIALRMVKDNLFRKKRNAAKEAWESIIKELDLGQHVSHKQASKKWENLKKKYKEPKRPRTGAGTDQGEETPATWPFFR
ncbi:Trihelix transcription factor GTL1 [Dissostichus eleginoides]|uniref:Trihelix transcription factor GTL1 n=1 Tax=Dissostichus eleginoides TaxID=100907 RepID=A0AAD9BVJ2_DISEL|nr:Trihelix transcription factor GTL1 [Dissostichus eleginoides]